MGLNKGGNYVYLSVANGKLVRTFKQATADTVSRINKKGNQVHEEFFKDITGFITKVDTKDSGYGVQLLISLNDDEQDYQIQLQLSSRYSASFLKALPNVELNNPVRLMPWQMTDKNDAKKMISGVTVYQDGTKIAPAFTKEDPNGTPEMKRIQQKVKGKMETTWDDSEMMEFLLAKAKEQFSKGTPKKPVETSDDEPSDSLPF